MSELIKREDAIKATWHEPSYIDPYNILTEVRDRIEALPTVDAVQVVRCGECKYHKKYRCINDMALWKHRCEIGHGTIGNEWFCADGERRTDDETKENNESL